MASLRETLANMYEKPSAMKKVNLMYRLFNLRMTEGASVTKYLNEFNTVTTHLIFVSINFDDEVWALIIFFFA